MNRRSLLRGMLLGAAALPLHRMVFAMPAKGVLGAPDAAVARLAALEAVHGGRLGVAIMDTGSGRQVGHRINERFLM